MSQDEKADRGARGDGAVMEYKTKDGEIMYGYSQTDLNKLVAVLWVFAFIMALGMGFMIFVFWYIDYHGILTNIVRSCVC